MIVLGRIVAPFGVQGWLKIHPFGDDPLSWRKMATWWIAEDAEAPADAWVAHPLRACRAHGKSVVAALADISDRNAAEAIQGWYVAAPREALPKPEVDEYYWGDLIGLEVLNQAGVRLGEVSGLLSTGAHDVLQVRDGEQERLIPFVGAYIGEVDLVARRMTVAWEADW